MTLWLVQYDGMLRENRAGIFKESMGARNWEEEGYRTGPPGYIGWRNSFLGLDSGVPYTFKNTGSGYNPTHVFVLELRNSRLPTLQVYSCIILFIMYDKMAPHEKNGNCSRISLLYKRIFNPYKKKTFFLFECCMTFVRILYPVLSFGCTKRLFLRLLVRHGNPFKPVT